MELTISKTLLSDALSLTLSFVAKKTTMPILNNLLISASEGKLKISATDLEITAIAHTQATIKQGGSTTVNARIFGDIVRELPDGDVTLKVKDGERLEISARSSKLRMNTVSAEEYPSLPGINFDPKGRVSSKELSDLIGRTLYATSQDETRFNLNGVCFEVGPATGGKTKKEKTLRLIATDGHRLGMVTRPVVGFELAERIIVPRKGLSEIKRIIDALEDTELGIEVREGFLVLQTPKAKISVHLIDGEFPDYNQVIPKTKGSLATMSVADIGQALRRVALMVSDKSKCVKFDFSPKSLRISSSSPELGDAVEEIAVNYQGEALSVGFNAQYFLDFLGTLGNATTIGIELNGPLGPGKFQPEGDDSCIGIIMPMRL